MNACRYTHAYLVPSPTLASRSVGFMDDFIMPGTLELLVTAFDITDLNFKICEEKKSGFG